MQDAVKSGSEAQISALFEKPDGDDYLLRMAKRCGGLQGLKVAVFHVPKGWEDTGKYWAMFHTWQELEQDHDPIYRVVSTPQGLKLGAEIPEWDCGGKLMSGESTVYLDPKAGDVHVKTDLTYRRDVHQKALLFRLSDVYRDIELWLGDRAANPIPVVNENEVGRSSHGFLRVGGLLAVEPSAGSIDLSYSGHLAEGAKYSDDRDQVTTDHAYITSFWIPTLGRLPFKNSMTIVAPKDWTVCSEGFAGKKNIQGDFASSVFHCPFPISYPKICAGKYVVANEATVDGHLLRTYQFEPIEKKRADATLDWMKKAIVFYDKNLGEFPFKEYDCFDGKDYYGIESYSYTILAPSITWWAVSHEMGHTYFGGLVPCPYVKDSWNEGMTQYVDDVLLHDNAQEVNRNALKGLDVHVPLTQMPVAWEYNGATYWRGAYAMEMLDAEIGHDKVLAALRAMIKDRVGKETTWSDLRPYFEKSSGENLKWFWDQWITGSTFPHVKISQVSVVKSGDKYTTLFNVVQE